MAGTAGILPVMSRAAPGMGGAITLGLASLGFVSLGLPEGMLGVAWPSIRASFGLPLDALGLLLGTFATGYFVSSAVSGRVLTRLGIGQALAISCGLTGVSLLGYAIVAVAQLGLAIGYWLTRHRYARPHHALRAEAAHTSARTESLPGLARQPVALLCMALFFVYVGLEAASGQWSFSLFTLSRGTPVGIAGVLVSAYWASLTVGRILFGVLVSHVSSERLLRVCMLVTVVAAGLIWFNVPVVSWLALAVLGLVYAPVFPVLIAETPARFGAAQTANAVGLQVAAAVAGGAALPSLIGVLAARISLEVVGPCLVVGGLVELCVYELLVRRAFVQPRSERSQSSEAANVPPGA